MSEVPESQPRQADRLIYAGLLGLSVAGVFQLVGKETMSEPLLVGAYFFASAVPLLAAGLVTDYARRAGIDVPKSRDVMGLLGAGGAVAGLGSLFFHFGVGPCLVYAAGCVIGFVLVRRL